MTRKFAVGGGVALVAGVVLFGVNWYRETRAVLVRRGRKREPWERAARDAGLA